MFRKITDPEILNELKPGGNLIGIDLRGADIAAVTIDLTNIHFEEAHLEGANLQGVNLSGAFLINAVLEGTHLEGAILTQAKIIGANFNEAYLIGAQLNDIRNFAGTSFIGAKCNNINLTDSLLRMANFSNAHFEETNLQNIDFRRTNLEGAKFNGANLKGAGFTITELKDADFEKVENAEFFRFDTDKLSAKQREQLGFPISLIQMLSQPIPNIDIEAFTELVRSDKWDKKEVNNKTYNALMIACSKTFLQNFALELIKSNKFKINHVGNDGNTALMLACISRQTDAALALIATGKSDPGNKNKNGDTALIFACQFNLEEVALALIATGECNLFILNNNGDSALKFATDNNLTKVVDAFPKNIIDVNQTGFDSINQENRVISDYLKESIYNVVLMIDNQFHLTSKPAILKQLNNTNNIKYGCIKEGNTSEFVLESNINYDTEYLSLSSLFGLQFLINLDEAKIITNPLAGNMFILRKNKRLVSIISKNFIDGRDGASSDHCQPGKATDVYDVFLATQDCGITNVDQEQGSEAIEESKDEFSGMSNKVTILYKEIKYPISVQEDTNVEMLKNLFLDELINKNINTDKNFNVRFLFKGKILNDDLPIEIKANPSEFVIQAVVNPKLGGKKTMKKRNKKTRRNKEKKSMKKGKNKRNKSMKKRKTIKKRK